MSYNNVKCKRCGTVWAHIDEIVESTEWEHKKQYGHKPEID